MRLLASYRAHVYEIREALAKVVPEMGHQADQTIALGYEALAALDGFTDDGMLTKVTIRDHLSETSSIRLEDDAIRSKRSLRDDATGEVANFERRVKTFGSDDSLLRMISAETTYRPPMPANANAHSFVTRRDDWLFLGVKVTTKTTTRKELTDNGLIVTPVKSRRDISVGPLKFSKSE